MRTLVVKMRTAAVAFLLVAVALVDVQAAGEKYGTELDHVDVNALMADEARMKALISCVLDSDESKCNDNAKIFKKHVGEIISTDCSKCSTQQDAAMGKLFVFMSERHPEEMKKILQKYDPTGEAIKNYGEKWRKIGFKL